MLALAEQSRSKSQMPFDGTLRVSLATRIASRAIVYSEKLVLHLDPERRRGNHGGRNKMIADSFFTAVSFKSEVKRLSPAPLWSSLQIIRTAARSLRLPSTWTSSKSWRDL